MSEPDFDELIADAVRDYRSATAPHIRPTGSDAAHVTARHRRNTRLAVASTLAVLVVLLPVAGYRVAHHGDNGPPPTTATHRPSPPPSATPTPTPSGTPTAPSSGTPTTTPPSGKPSTTPPSGGGLADATLEVPSWGSLDEACPHGSVRLRDGMYVSGRESSDTPQTYGLGTVVSTDVDHDGAPDLVALLQCDRSDPGIQQVVAYHRTTGGAVHLIGRVLAEDAADTVDTVNQIYGITADPDGDVTVRVSDAIGSGGGTTYSGQIEQDRTYGWDGHGFHQTAGSRTFATSAYQLDITTGDLHMTRSASGDWAGHIDVTVHNRGSATIHGVSVAYASGDNGDPTLHPAAGCGTPTDYSLISCAIGTIGPGRTGTLRLNLTIPADDTDTFTTHPGLTANDVVIQVRVGDQAVANQPPLGKVVF
jgi:hypothetical protein